MTAPAEQAELVRLALAGNKDAFVELIELHKDMVFGLAYQNSPDASEAEDTAQEAILRAYRDLRKLRAPERFGQWLYGITINVARERMRTSKLTVPLESAPNCARRTMHQNRRRKKTGSSPRSRPFPRNTGCRSPSAMPEP